MLAKNRQDYNNPATAGFLNNVMLTRIFVEAKVIDTRATMRRNRLIADGFSNISDLQLIDVYTLDKKFPKTDLLKIAKLLTNPVIQKFYLADEISKCQVKRKFDWAIEIGYLPGVTDNVGSTAKECIEDLLRVRFSNSENIYSSQITLLQTNLKRQDLNKIVEAWHNPLIQKADIKSYRDFTSFDFSKSYIPKVLLEGKPSIKIVDLNKSDHDLFLLGKLGITNNDGSRRGPLALSLSYLKAIKNYFQKLGRNPTDIELESLAQTWSEHCKHTIFNDPVDEIKEGLFKHYIKRATDEIRVEKGKKDICVSIFADNSGCITFNKNSLVTHKVETHNTPSALDPFGGSVTGIVGVNRDTIGFGLGAKPIANIYGFCLSDPRGNRLLYKDSHKNQKMLPERQIMDGVIRGINAGGNQSGIPTPMGFIYFNDKYRGKPLVFAGTVGLIPGKIKDKDSFKKKALPGDYIVMTGGRVGKDGIHGATFSSEALSKTSPVTAVQIGDPITQKKLSDCLIKEARNMLLYHSITDNGAGGLSCSIAEMAKESNGCLVDLDTVPLKYNGLNPWEIWISESQERMTLAVGPSKWKKLYNLLKSRGVEATVIGRFTSSGKCQVRYKKKIIMDIDLEFLHYGLPKISRKSNYQIPKVKNLLIKEKKDLTKEFLKMMENLNIANYSFISEQYDYMVQGTSVLPPLQGKGRVNANAVCIRPLLNSAKGLGLSYGLYPSYSDLDPYRMAAGAIDTAVRNLISIGVNPDKIVLLDNFCWTDPENPKRLGQLKLALKACYDYAKIYQTPFISGKDSMYNDFEGFNKSGRPVTISILPTLLISSIGIIEDMKKTVSLEAKFPGDLIYVLGDTDTELGGSEYLGTGGGKVPAVNGRKNKKLYSALNQAIADGLIASSQSLGKGGLAVALAKTAMGGMLGMTVSLKNLAGYVRRDDFALFSESQGRILITLSPANKKPLEKIFKDLSYSHIGEINSDLSFRVLGRNDRTIIATDIKKVIDSYRKTFAGY